MVSIILMLKSALTYGLYYSVKTGQFIVRTVHVTVLNLLSFLNKLLTLLAIILEDFIIFLQDVLQRIRHFLDFLTYIGECLVYGTHSLVEHAHNSLKLIWVGTSTVVDGILNGIVTIFNGIGSIFAFVKHVIILFGDGVWFIVIFVPKSILSLGPLALYHLNQLCVQTFSHLYLRTCYLYNAITSFVTNCYNFITDVPVESAIGVVIAICFVYIFLQFYSILFIYFRNIFSSFLIGLRLKYNQLKRIVGRILSQNRRPIRPTPRPVLAKPSTSHENGSKFNEDRFCIICQDRDKCILVLPCKHLCLCNECATRVMYYTGCCPICRKQIQRTMKIFT